jgi:D-amino peptidase
LSSQTYLTRSDPTSQEVDLVRLLICVDVEGISGIGDHRMLASGVRNEGKKLATDDLLAAIRGIRRASPEAAIDVFDAHGQGGNLLEDDVSEACTLLGGGWMTTLKSRVLDGSIAEYDVALLLGQHAAGGTVNGFMSHTNSMFVASRWNGMDAGEAPQLAWLLGHFEVPVGVVVGDEAVCREVDASLDGVATVVVKKAGANRGIADCIPLESAHAAIEEASALAVSQCSGLTPQRLTTPVSLEIAYFFEQMADMAEQFPGFSRIGPRAVGFTAPDVLDAWHAYNTSRVISDAGGKAKLLSELASIEAAVERYHEVVADLNTQWLEGDLPFPAVSR